MEYFVCFFVLRLGDFWFLFRWVRVGFFFGLFVLFYFKCWASWSNTPYISWKLEMEKKNQDSFTWRNQLLQIEYFSMCGADCRKIGLTTHYISWNAGYIRQKLVQYMWTWRCKHPVKTIFWVENYCLSMEIKFKQSFIWKQYVHVGHCIQ